MVTGVDKFVVSEVCGELLFNQALHDPRGSRGMVDRSTVGWVKSCAFLIYGDYDGRFPLGTKAPHWTERSNIFVNNVELLPLAQNWLEVTSLVQVDR